MLSVEARESWLEKANRLIAHGQAEEPPRLGEGVAIQLVKEGSSFVIATNHVTREGLTALRAMACVAVADLGQHAVTAIKGATPELADELELPESCTALALISPAAPP